MLAALPEGNIERKRIRDGCVEICTTAHGGAGGIVVGLNTFIVRVAGFRASCIRVSGCFSDNCSHWLFARCTCMLGELVSERDVRDVNVLMSAAVRSTFSR